MNPVHPFRLLLASRFLGASFLLLFAGHPWRAFAQLSTVEHLAHPGFWPTQVNRSSADFVGQTVCAKCHPDIAVTQKITPMAHTVSRVVETETLRLHPQLNFRQGHFKYEIASSAVGSTYTVTDGTRSLSVPLVWAFGAGQVGQSYLYLLNGSWYEARATFFGTLGNLHFTPGRALISPHDLDEAMSRPVSKPDVVRCFKCHATGVTSEYSVDTKTLFLGISCEACHGPGGKHVAAIEAEILQTGTPSGDPGRHLIFNPRDLNAADSVDFCGACHSTSWDVRLSRSTGIATLLSPPYRLQKSKCWAKGDSRLACIACHDPHATRERRAEAYDTKCLACHASATSSGPTADHPGRACTIGKTKCVSCHMPKVQNPDFHYAFTDHDIRIFRPDETFPP
jgi:hypothetical protein